MQALNGDALDEDSSDDGVMLRYQAGDMSAGGEIDLRYRRRLESLAILYLPNNLRCRWHLAEDLAATTLMKVVLTVNRKRARWDPTKGTVGVWLGGILRNEVKNFLRLRKGKESLGTDLGYRDDDGREILFGENIQDNRPGPIQQLETREEFELVRQGVTELAPELSDMLKKKYFDGLSNGEISREYELSEPTISRRLAEARNQLRRALAVFMEPIPRSATRSLSL